MDEKEIGFLHADFDDIKEIFDNFCFIYGDKWMKRCSDSKYISGDWLLCLDLWLENINKTLSERMFEKSWTKKLLRYSIEQVIALHEFEPPTLPEFLKIIENA